MEEGMKGIFEELKQKSKTYPANRRELPVPPEAWLEHLISHTSRQLSEHLYQLQEQEQFSELLETVHQVLSLTSTSPPELVVPLLRILFTNDESAELPTYPEHLTLPKLLMNKKELGQNFFKSLKFELDTSNKIDFVVSFVRASGLQLLTNPLEDLRKRGGSGRILTSTYMGITEPEALRKLLQMEHISARIIHEQEQSFHIKAYLFSRESEVNTALIGSSNLSKAALHEGQEWNVRLPDSHHFSVYKECQEQFERLWDGASALTEEFITLYEEQRKSMSAEQSTPWASWYVSEPQTEAWGKSHDVLRVEPNEMQAEALEQLQLTRERGMDRAAVVAATGTGKTFLAAFEVKQCCAKRLLFIAHRNELLDNARKTFETVFQSHGTGLCGMFTGETKQQDAPFVFASIQTISREETLASFAEDAFDYVIVDEFHHAEAPTYRRVLDHFKPDFLLGLTATPERMDGKDVLAICDHNVVFELRLREALEMELLAPFHYFGVADDTVDYDTVKEKNGLFDVGSLAENLKTEARVEHVIRNIRLYGYHGEQLCALGFCVNVDHAQFMSEAFQRHNIPAMCLSGQDDNDTRIEAIQRLQSPNDPLQVIFTVNIFNEGVDIPALNMLLFLRPTDSSIVFIQQLGRGLRKYEGKEYLTVLDFIGNYRNSFVVPMALAGETAKTFDKKQLENKVRNEFSDLPGECYVDLDAITKRRILTTLEHIKVNSSDWLRRLYFLFRRDLGRSPDILDLLYAEGAPNFNAFVRKYGSWINAKKRFRDLSEEETSFMKDEYLLEVIERIEQMLPLKWPYEFAILGTAFASRQKLISLRDVWTQLRSWFGVELDLTQHKSLILRAMTELAAVHKKQDWSFGNRRGEAFEVSEEFLQLGLDKAQYHYLNERFTYGITLFRRHFKPHFLEAGKRLVPYQNYTREDLQFLFEDKAAKGSWREGVKRLEKRYFLFVNLFKDEELKEELRYHDYFIDPKTFHWQSQNQTSHGSNTGQNFIHHKEQNYEIHLLIRRYAKLNGETLPFMYVGEVDYVRSHGDRPMNIVWRLHHPVPDAIFTDFVRG